MTQTDAFTSELKAANKLAAELESRARVSAMRRSIVTKRITLTSVGKV